MGYTKKQILTYYLVVSYLFACIYVYLPVASEIQTGFMSIFLTKPINYLWQHYWRTLARTFFRQLIGLPVVILLFYLLRDHIFIVIDPWAYLTLVLTILGAINILFLIDVLLSLVEFWVFNAESLKFGTDTIAKFLAGSMIPIIFLPGLIQTIANFLPFKYTGVFLIDAFLGKISTLGILQGIAVQVLWTVILVCIVKIVWRQGLKKYEAVGA